MSPGRRFGVDVRGLRPDAIHAIIQLMEANAARLQFRNAYNVTAMSITPAEHAVEIRKHVPEFAIDYHVDPV
jgi:hypothetical protein